jgi:acrylyl-CoA reductase (NADPH)
MSPFKAYLIEEQEGLTRAGFVAMDESQLDPGEVTIKVAYSSVNYKDALAATGAGRIIRRYPCVGGIDLSGTVTNSSDLRFRTGDAVIATSFDIGVAHHGGYAEYARVPADWVVPLPSGLSLHAAMALGTAGFTAALWASCGWKRMDCDPSQGPVIVSGATGGVGSLAVDMLATRGYQVTALTGKESERRLSPAPRRRRR